MRKKILLIDDDAAVVDYLTAKLGGEFDLITTSSPEQALRLVHEDMPDLVICDIDLHSGLDGGDISGALYRDPETQHIPLIYLTALVSPSELASRENQLAGRAAISKHEPTEQIIARIRATLG